MHVVSNGSQADASERQNGIMAYTANRGGTNPAAGAGASVGGVAAQTVRKSTNPVAGAGAAIGAATQTMRKSTNSINSMGFNAAAAGIAAKTFRDMAKPTKPAAGTGAGIGASMIGAAGQAMRKAPNLNLNQFKMMNQG